MNKLLLICISSIFILINIIIFMWSKIDKLNLSNTALQKSIELNNQKQDYLQKGEDKKKEIKQYIINNNNYNVNYKDKQLLELKKDIEGFFIKTL